jgi:hypothetical protein
VLVPFVLRTISLNKSTFTKTQFGDFYSLYTAISDYLFVYSPTSNFSAIWWLSPDTITNDMATNSDLCLALMAISSEGSLRVTPTATQDLGLYGLRPAPTSHCGIRTCDAKMGL